MNMQHPLSVTLLLVGLGVLSACGGDKPVDKASVVPGNNEALAQPGTALPEIALPADANTSDDARAAVIGASEIPYPVYPNGSKYRVGGENGLKIVVFETTDSFEQVDRFYQQAVEPAGMPRLVAMNDYVRYSSSNEDKDPWATYRPGIVIHEFDGDDARRAVGADDEARTNIIMSF